MSGIVLPLLHMPPWHEQCQVLPSPGTVQQLED